MSISNYYASSAVLISEATEMSKAQSLFLKTLESRGRERCANKYNRNINKDQRWLIKKLGKY